MASKVLPFKRPIVGKSQAVELARSLFGFHVSQPEHIKELESYDDRNFYVKGRFQRDGGLYENDSHTDEEYVLKILNRVDSRDSHLVDAQNEFTLFLSQNDIQCPVPVKSLNNDYKVMWNNSESQGNSEAGVTEAVRLLKFIPGRLIKDVPCTPILLHNLGRYTARFTTVAQKFFHPAVEQRIYHWDLQHIRQIEQYINMTADEDDCTEPLKQVYKKFTEEVLPCISAFSKQMIQGDFNEANILVVKSSSGEGYRVSGILDFGDISYSYRLFEVAICMAYMIVMMCEAGRLHSDAIHAAGYVLSGYQEVSPLSQTELGLIYWTVAARMCQSVAIGEHQASLEPSNVYLQCGLKTMREVLKHYVNIPKKELRSIWTSIKLA